MAKNLVIVESPAKAKTIEKILGKDFTVKSSFGHVRDLDKGDKGVDIDKDYQPNYVVSAEKKKVVNELKKAAKSFDEVWLATDEDREGEAISWHLCKVLGLDEHETKRIVFREITKPAILKAIQQPRTIDLNVVNAQQARRILDRLVGFELSELLWRKIKGKLSAGRVQSVAVKLIVEREREINNFAVEAFFKLTALFLVKNNSGQMVELKAELPRKFAEQDEAQAFLEACIGASFFISNIEVKPTKRRPAAPFTTSTLQQEASRKLGFAVKRTMQNAQRLYEQGFITYMRTDSTTLSELALTSIAAEVESKYGSKYVQTRQYTGKKKLAQEAHEAIRPSYIDRPHVSSDYDQQRLYELIWKRTIASQMSDARLEKTTVEIEIDKRPDDKLQAVGEVVVFDGFLKVYLESKDEDESDEVKGMLPPLSKGQALDMSKMMAVERFTRPPARYTEAGLVKKMEELGIGRPSTYAPTISKIMEEGRGYVVKESREGKERAYKVLILENEEIAKKNETEITGTSKNRLYSTDMGMLVSDFLEEHFEDIMNYQFTANMEGRFDEVSTGKLMWTALLNGFYPQFHEKVLDIKENAARANGERILGKDPETGRTLLVRMSRLGRPVAQIGAQDELAEDEKPKYGNFKPGLSIESITFEEALELFSLPKTLGTFENVEVIIGSGRYGPYVKFKDQYVSIPKSEDPMTLTLDRSIELIKEKRQADAPIGTFQDLPISKGKGRFGPFVKWDSKFFNIAKKYDFEELTVDEAIEIIQIKLEKEANRYIHQWPDEKISVENGRWGPFIRFGKKNVKLPKINDEKMTSEEAKELALEEVKDIIEEELPGSFKKKKAAKKAK